MPDEPTAKIYRNCLVGLVMLLLTALFTLLGAMWWEIDSNGDLIRELQHDFEHWTAGGGQ